MSKAFKGKSPQSRPVASVVSESEASDHSGSDDVPDLLLECTSCKRAVDYDQLDGVGAVPAVPLPDHSLEHASRTRGSLPRLPSLVHRGALHPAARPPRMHHLLSPHGPRASTRPRVSSFSTIQLSLATLGEANFGSHLLNLNL